MVKWWISNENKQWHTYITLITKSFKQIEWVSTEYWVQYWVNYMAIISSNKYFVKRLNQTKRFHNITSIIYVYNVQRNIPVNNLITKRRYRIRYFVSFTSKVVEHSTKRNWIGGAKCLHYKSLAWNPFLSRQLNFKCKTTNLMAHTTFGLFHILFNVYIFKLYYNYKINRTSNKKTKIHIFLNYRFNSVVNILYLCNLNDQN